MNKQLTNCEFFSSPCGDPMLHNKTGTRIVIPSDRAIIQPFVLKVDTSWPLAAERLNHNYKQFKFNTALFEYKKIRRFINCNLANFDSTPDIDKNGFWHFEEVFCPLRGECRDENVICKPKFYSGLSVRVLEIMNHYCSNLSPLEIAEITNLSEDTIKTHKRNAFKTINVHSLPEFINYSNHHNLFNN